MRRSPKRSGRSPMSRTRASPEGARCSISTASKSARISASGPLRRNREGRAKVLPAGLSDLTPLAPFIGERRRRRFAAKASRVATNFERGACPAPIDAAGRIRYKQALAKRRNAAQALATPGAVRAECHPRSRRRMPSYVDLGLIAVILISALLATVARLHPRGLGDPVLGFRGGGGGLFLSAADPKTRGPRFADLHQQGGDPSLCRRGRRFSWSP